MMSLVDFRDSAVRLQQEAHERREHHRRLQKECEIEDQTLRKYLRATDALIEAKATYDGIAAELSPHLRLSLGLVEKPPLVETKSTVFVPTVVEVVAQPEEQVAAEVIAPVLPEPPARKEIAAVPASGHLRDRILAIFEKNRHGDTASVEAETIYRLTSASSSRVKRAVDQLAQEGKLRLCRAGKGTAAGCFTVILKTVRASEAAE